jgi:HAD superfamily hydrolase (TIGR01549 family)
MDSDSILWDFDGVIVESVALKGDAFYELYLPYGKAIAQKVRTYHLAHGGISRQEKIRFFHREFLGETVSDEEVKILSEKFSRLVVDGVLNAPVVPGARELLMNAKYSHFLITGTPEEEIRFILEKLELLHFFRRITGAPVPKTKAVADLIAEKLIIPERSVFIGDAREDLKAASANGIRFILRETRENEELFTDFHGQRLKNFLNLSVQDEKH